MENIELGKKFIDAEFKRDFFAARGNSYLPISLLNKIEDFYDKRKDILDYNDPVLIHNDLTCDNILIKDEKISGIIDAGDCVSGDPMYEFGFMNRHYFNKGVMESFYEGYGRIDSRRADFYTVIDSIPTKPKRNEELRRLIEVINHHIDLSNH